MRRGRPVGLNTMIIGPGVGVAGLVVGLLMEEEGEVVSVLTGLTATGKPTTLTWQAAGQTSRE